MKIKKLKFYESGDIVGEALYVINSEENCCVFTGITKNVTTINFCSRIMKDICKAEGWSPNRISEKFFFDLQTGASYTHKPGQFEYDNTYYDDSTGWNPKKCPQWVIDTFREQIGGEVPFQRWDRSKELSLIHEKYHETFDRIEKPQGLYAYEFI